MDNEFTKNYKEKYEKQGNKGCFALGFGVIGVITFSIIGILLLFLLMLKDLF